MSLTTNYFGTTDLLISCLHRSGVYQTPSFSICGGPFRSYFNGTVAFQKWVAEEKYSIPISFQQYFFSFLSYIPLL
ncbi:hypothetical protein QTP88_018257 [Uroleucon formosanum]